MVQSDIQPSGWRLALWQRKRAQPLEPKASVLAPYQPVTRSRTKRVIGFACLFLFCFIYSFYFSIVPASFIPFLLAPLVVIALLVVWALPDAGWAPTHALEWLFYAMFISLIVWPNYLAISLRGLPWMTLLRLTSFPLLFVLLVCMSVSVEFRGKLSQSLRSIRAIPILWCIFVVIQLISIGFSKDIAGSVQRFIVAQTSWTAVFFAGAYIFRSPGRIQRWAMMLWVMAAFVSLIAIWEFKIGHLPWRDHIPSILNVQDESVARILAGSMRAGTTRYRTEATFSTPLGLAEYIALTIPFVLHFTTARFAPKIRLTAICSVPLLLVGCYLTDAKLGMVGCLFGILLYIFAAAFNNWRRNKASLMAASILFSYPVGVGLLIAAMLLSHRFQVVILGTDGSHANSTNARIEQYTMGLQKSSNGHLAMAPA